MRKGSLRGGEKREGNKAVLKPETYTRLWNETCELKNISSMTEKRWSMLQVRLREYGEGSFKTIIENVNASAFLKGQNDRGWMATLDWVIKPNNYVKVLEGNYSDTKKTSGKNKENKYGHLF